MKKSLLRRMAPLLAGMLLGAATISASANYAYITGLPWANDYATVTCDTTPPYPYVLPRDAYINGVPNNFYWWFNGNNDYAQYENGKETAHTVDPNFTVTNVCVYVYGTNNDYGWAINDQSTGVSIYNVP